MQSSSVSLTTAAAEEMAMIAAAASSEAAAIVVTSGCWQKPHVAAQCNAMKVSYNESGLQKPLDSKFEQLFSG